MKRSQLQRKTALSRTTWLRSRPKPINRTDPARMAWKTSQAGMCECAITSSTSNTSASKVLRYYRNETR